MPKIAVIKTGGKQYKVGENDRLKIEKIKGEKDSKVEFDKVFLIADESGKDVKIGTPEVKGAKVEAKILEQGRGKKINVIKYKSKIRYSIKKGHKQHFTKVQITGIKA